MSLEYALASVVGSDNVAPVYNADALFHIWNMEEIYLGGPGQGKYIPKIGDVIMEIVGATITRYIVKGINEITLVPIWVQEDISKLTEQLSDIDILFGVGPGTQSDTYRVCVDKSVIPHRMSVDSRLKVGGSTVLNCKIFKGADISAESGKVISGIYNANNQLITENVPLELVATNTLINHSIKVVMPCYTTEDLKDGEVVTAVFYDNAGFVVSKRQLLVENTAWIRDTNAERKYVIGISLETPFLSPTINNEIVYPLNVPLNAINLIGVVEYSDGSKLRMAVDSTRFSIAGLDTYAATILGQKSRVVLKYALGVNETAINVQTTDNGSHVPATYTIVTGQPNGNYAVQLFGYPEWVDAVTGYRMHWWLYDLDRSISYDVTPNVVIYGTVTPFDPKLYGVKQTIKVGVNLRDVNGTYKNFTHVQFLDVILNKAGNNRPDLDFVPNWEVASVAGQTPTYGKDVFATFVRVTTSSYKLKLAGNLATQVDWLNKVYRSTNPLVNTFDETQAPAPTHFKLIAGTNVREMLISEWNSEISLSQALTNNGTVYLKFFKRTTDGDLQLAAAGMQLYQQDSNGNYI